MNASGLNFATFDLAKDDALIKKFRDWLANKCEGFTILKSYGFFKNFFHMDIISNFILISMDFQRVVGANRYFRHIP